MKKSKHPTSQPAPSLTIDELERYWLDCNINSTKPDETLERYVKCVRSLCQQDIHLGAARLMTMLAAWIDSIVNPDINTSIVVRKQFLLFDLLTQPDVAAHVLKSSEGRYALVTFAFCEALSSNFSYNVTFDTLWKAVFEKEVGPFIPDFTSDARITQQVACLLLPQPWCILVEPSLFSCESIAQSIWLERPALLNTPIDKAHFDVLLPETMTGNEA